MHKHNTKYFLYYNIWNYKNKYLYFKKFRNGAMI